MMSVKNYSPRARAVFTSSGVWKMKLTGVFIPVSRMIWSLTGFQCDEVGDALLVDNDQQVGRGAASSV